MRKLALSDEILMKIEKPARYIGGEFNAIVKDHNEVDTTFAFVIFSVESQRVPSISKIIPTFWTFLIDSFIYCLLNIPFKIYI